VLLREIGSAFEKDNQMDDPVIVCVLGMHRSGTSLITRALNLLGVELGPEEHHLEPAPDNPRGFWEHRRFMKLNEKILARRGGDTCDPPPAPPGWEKAGDLEDLRQRARAILEQDFAGARMWGWKDPRTCLTLPFWQHLLPPMRYVLCFRNPVDVARSLQRRDGFSTASGINLWLAYTQRAIRDTAGQPRVVVFYDEFLDDWKWELCRLAEFIDVPSRAQEGGVLRGMADFLDQDLRHHRTSPRDSMDGARLGVPARAHLLAQQAYFALQEQREQGLQTVDPLLTEALEILRPEIEAEQKQAHQDWLQGLDAAVDQILSLVPPGEPFILVDEEQWGLPPHVEGRRRISFLERDGEYWGRPSDDTTAIQELERLRQSGACFLLFGWPAFWWLDHYAGFYRHLKATYPCTVQNERLVGFELRR
jgi:hypothetical protein